MSNKDIYSELKANEKVIWLGKPDRFEALDKQYSRPFILLAAVCAVIDVVLIALYSSYALTNGIRINIPVLLIINACSLAPVLNYLLKAKQILSSEYCITDQRILHYSGSKKIKEIKFDNIKEYKARKDKAGTLSLVIGRKAIQAKSSSMRALSAGPALSNKKTEEIASAVLYSIPEEAVDSLREYIALSL